MSRDRSCCVDPCSPMDSSAARQYRQRPRSTEMPRSGLPKAMMSAPSPGIHVCGRCASREAGQRPAGCIAMSVAMIPAFRFVETGRCGPGWPTVFSCLPDAVSQRAVERPERKMERPERSEDERSCVAGARPQTGDDGRAREGLRAEGALWKGFCAACGDHVCDRSICSWIDLPRACSSVAEASSFVWASLVGRAAGAWRAGIGPPGPHARRARRAPAAGGASAPPLNQ